MTAGGVHTCGLRTDGTVVCWGARYEFDEGQTDAPDGLFTAVTAGSRHSCGLRTDGTITCWGSNEVLDGFVAESPDESDGGPPRVCVTVFCAYGVQWQSPSSDGQFTAVSAGGSHSCGLRTDGTITCWGANDSGQANPPTG